jgi:hypothetical protein
MSRSDSGSDAASSSSDDSDHERSEKRDLVIPTPVELSDSADDGVSPSQHKLAMQNQLNRKNVAPNSTSGSDEEDEEVEEEVVDQSIDGESGTFFQSKSSAATFSRITELSRQLAEMTELHRKQQLMENKKTARSSLSFDSPPPAKSRRFKAPFTPPRTAADIIGATQADEDFERDSLASQSSRSTARIRLQEKYVKVATLYKDEMTPEELKKRVRDIAFSAMSKSVIFEDIDAADRDYGGFKRNNVRPCLGSNLYFYSRSALLA